MSIHMFIDGVPIPQGSKTVYNGRAVDANALKLKPWRKHITQHATLVMDGQAPLTGPRDGEPGLGAPVRARPGRHG